MERQDVATSEARNAAGGAVDGLGTLEAGRPEEQIGEWEANDDVDEIRYSLTALGVAVMNERRRGPRFRGFGPCAGSVCA